MEVLKPLKEFEKELNRCVKNKSISKEEAKNYLKNYEIYLKSHQVHIINKGKESNITLEDIGKAIEQIRLYHFPFMELTDTWGKIKAGSSGQPIQIELKKKSYKQLREIAKGNFTSLYGIPVVISDGEK